jgi:subtilisin-like proprotein convertase family protein
MKRRITFLSLALVLAACGPVEPRFGSVSVSAAAPRASLTGHTSATGAPAIDLSPGCPGFVDSAIPEHVVRLDDASAITITARSLRGPLAIAVVGPGEVRCDSDEGTGHAPHVTVTQPGEYLVHVGALEAPADLSYELTLGPATTGAAGVASSGDQRVSVTITSDPSGATVRTPQGETLGTTPAMFVMTVPESEIGSERHFVLEMPGHPSTEVGGRVIGETMVLHAALTDAVAVAAVPSALATPTLTSGTLDAVGSGAAVPIRDYRTSTQTLSVPTACSIGSMSVEIDAQHAYSQDLRITLRGPSGAQATLANHGGGSRPYSPHAYAWDDVRGALHVFAGTNVQGTWTLEVRDDAGEDEGALRAFTLHVTCGDASAAPAPPPAIPPVSSTPRPPRPPRPQPRVLDPWAARPPPSVAPPPPTHFQNGPGASRPIY